MALEGTFKDFHVADIVQLIGLQRKSGTLSLESDQDSLIVIFQEGAVVWVQSSRLPWEQRMAEVLVAQGLLTPAQLQDALSLRRETGKALKVVLAEKGFLSPKEWQRVLAVEVTEAVYRPFGWETGRYRFVSQSSVDLAEGSIDPLGAEAVLMEGIRRADEWPMIREKIPSVAAVFRVASRPGPLNPGQVEPGDIRMLDLVDGKRTVHQLADSSGMGEFEAMRSLAALVEAGAIVGLGPARVPRDIEAPPARIVAPLRARSSVPPPAWLARVAWGLAAAWLVANLVLFRAEPLGILPLSAARVRMLDGLRSLRARADLAELSRGLERYAATTGEYPAGPESLGTWDRGALLQDPWGHPYQVRRADPNPGADVRVFSAGPDGRAGTPDDIALSDG